MALGKLCLDLPFYAVLSKLFMIKMDRAGFAVFMLLTVALVRAGSGHKDATGGRKESAGADRALWDQQQQQQWRLRSQGHLPRGPGDGASSKPSGETSPRTSQHRTLIRVPRAAASSRAGPAHAAGASREDHASAPRDGAQRTARQAGSVQERARVNRRQSSKSANSRRLVG